MRYNVTLQPGDSIISRNQGFKFFFVRVLLWILFRFPYKKIREHVDKYFGDALTFGADTKGVTFYPLDRYKKAKRLMVFRHPSYNDKGKQEQFQEVCRKIEEKKLKYGIINYIIWFFGVGVVYFPVIFLAFGWPWLTTSIAIMGYVAFGSFLPLIFKGILKGTMHCYESATRIDQEKMGIWLGVVSPEWGCPNYLLMSYAGSWKMIVDCEPAKGEWPIRETKC